MTDVDTYDPYSDQLLTGPEVEDEYPTEAIPEDAPNPPSPIPTISAVFQLVDSLPPAGRGGRYAAVYANVDRLKELVDSGQIQPDRLAMVGTVPIGEGSAVQASTLRSSLKARFGDSPAVAGFDFNNRKNDHEHQIYAQYNPALIKEGEKERWEKAKKDAAEKATKASKATGAVKATATKKV